MVAGAEFTGAGLAIQRGRRPDHAARELAAPLLARRAPEPVERGARRDVDRRPAADAARARSSSTPSASAGAWRSSRDHRLGPGQRPRVAAVAGADRARPVVRRAPLAAARPADPGPDGADGARRARDLQGRDGRMDATERAVARPAHRRRQALRHRVGVRPARDRDRRRPEPAGAGPVRRRTTAVPVPRIDDPGVRARARARCASEFGVGAVVPLTDLDLEVLAHARVAGRAARVRARTRRSRARRSTSTRRTCCWSGSGCPRRRRSCPASRCPTTR